MPRQPRVHESNAVYHVTSRGVEKRVIYLTDADRRTFLCYLREAAQESRVSLFSYCLMSNHFHLLLAIEEKPLGVFMQKLLTRYSIYFNRIHERVGHLVQGRYHAAICENLGYLIQTVAYIHRNPVRAGIVSTPSEWPWSSHQELLDGGGPILNLSRLGEIVGMTPLELKESYLDRLKTPQTAQRVKTPTLQQLIDEAAAQVGINPTELLMGRRGGKHTRAKRTVADWALAAGYHITEVAYALNCTHQALSKLTKKKVAAVPDP